MNNYNYLFLLFVVCGPTIIFCQNLTNSTNNQTTITILAHHNQSNIVDEREAKILHHHHEDLEEMDSIGNKIMLLLEENLQDELDTWEAPYEMRKLYPYYHSGFDEDGRPIWIAELGRWNFRKVTDGGEKTEKIFLKYLEQLAHRIIKSLAERRTPDNPVTDTKLIVDMEEFSLVDVAHVPTVSLILKAISTFRELIDKYLFIGICVNTNAAASGLVTLLRPVLGSILERVEVYGTNKANWLPHVLRKFPRDQLPEWYGGKGDWRPVKIFG